MKGFAPPVDPGAANPAGGSPRVAANLGSNSLRRRSPRAAAAAAAAWFGSGANAEEEVDDEEVAVLLVVVVERGNTDLGGWGTLIGL